MLNVDEYQAYVELFKEKQNLEKKLEKIKKRLKQLESGLIDQLLQNNMTRISVDEKTVYIRNQIWAKISNKEKAIEALRAEGYDDYVKPGYNSNQVSKLLRELDERDEDLPVSFKGVIEPSTKTTLGVTKSK